MTRVHWELELYYKCTRSSFNISIITVASMTIIIIITTTTTMTQPPSCPSCQRLPLFTIQGEGGQQLWLQIQWKEEWVDNEWQILINTYTNTETNTNTNTNFIF